MKTKLTEERIKNLAEALLKGMHYPTDFTHDEIISILNCTLSIVQENKQKQEADIIAQGERIADLASRLLNKEMTADDLAYCMNQYIKSNNIDLPSNITGETIIKIFDDTEGLVNKTLSPVDVLTDFLQNYNEDTDSKKIKDFIKRITNDSIDDN